VALSARTVDQDATQPGSLGEAPQSIEAIGGEALVVQTDLGNRADLQKLVDVTVARFGGIDVLVNNAAATTGLFGRRSFLDLTYEEWLHDFDINLHADRLLQKAVARILGAIFEVDFCNASYGYRPGRSPHHALRALRTQIRTGWVNHVFEADIRGYFTHICHAWLQKMLRERIADPVILSLIGKWLRARGAMQDALVKARAAKSSAGYASGVLSVLWVASLH
jgi:NAD(P)-dependent dehydrogenase (short-subunit alcohol dehydrogenase family)